MKTHHLSMESLMELPYSTSWADINGHKVADVLIDDRRS